MFWAVRLENCCRRSVDEVVWLDLVFIDHVFIVTQIIKVGGLQNMSLIACSVAGLLSVGASDFSFSDVLTQTTLVLKMISSYFSYSFL